MRSPTVTDDPKRRQEEGIHKVNQEFRRYEQVNKDQSYSLSEDRESDEFDDDFEIKTCDMASYFKGGQEGRRAFADELGNALKEIGFAILVNHGVDPTLYDQAEKRVCEFFETTSREERMPYLAKRHGSVNQGYFPIKETTIIHPDLVEGWVFCRRAFDLDSPFQPGRRDPAWNESDFWPRSNYEPFFRRIVQSHENLISPLMRSILLSLGCDPHLYDTKLDKPNFGFRLNYYPPLTQEQESTGGGRMLGHEDVDLFTILPAPKHEGLQVLNRSNMKWIRLNPPPGTIILNTGDYMQRITNDLLPSTTHRVSPPRQEESQSAPRVSIPKAVYVREEELLEVLPGLGPPKYEPVSAIRFHTRITSKYYGDEYAVDSDQ